MTYKCIIAMVKPDLTDTVISSAKKAGATGATVISASGTGAGEAKTFFGLNLDVRTELIVCLVEEAAVAPILSAIGRAGRFHEHGTGIAMVLPVDQAIGVVKDAFDGGG